MFNCLSRSNKILTCYLKSKSNCILQTNNLNEINNLNKLISFNFSKSNKNDKNEKIEKGEKLEETVRREIKEETRIKDMAIINGFKETIKYFFKFEGNNILKFVTFFLAETKKKQVKISPEHIGFKWLPYKEAEVQLTHENAKEILRKANKFLLNGKITPRLTK